MGHRSLFGKKLFMFSAAAILFCGMFSPQFVFAGDKKIGDQCTVTADCVQGAGCQNNICIADSFGTVDVGGAAGLAGGDIRTTVGRIIQIVLGLLGVIAVGIILFGGFTYMTAGGSDDKVESAKKIITNGVIGLVIILASFAIVRFIFSSLSNATGTGTVPPPPICDDPSGICKPPVCTDPKLCEDNDYPKCVDTNNFFVAESISPNQQKETGINNIVIRALFSKSVATPADKVFQIAQGGSVIASNLFSYAFVPNTNNRIIEATYISPDGICKGTEKNCLPLSKYNVKLLPGIKDTAGTLLQNEEAEVKCGGGFAGLVKDGASFTVDKQENDPQKPTIEAGLLIDGKLTSDAGIKVPVGKQYSAEVTVKDTSGIAHLHVELFSSTQDAKIIDEWYAPVNNTAADFSKKITFAIANTVKANTNYTLKFTAQDIDHQTSSLGLFFIAVGQFCNDQIQNGDETGVDTGGSCGGGAGASCQFDADCANAFQCIKNSCTPRPYIVSVSPMDGASGNWITIYGKNFGDQAGTVEFGVTDGDTKPFVVKNDKWYPAGVVDCQQSGSSWSNKQIFIEVPADSDLFKVGSKSVIKVKAKNGTEDTTINNVGFIPAPDGRFVKNTIVRPGLCSVITHNPPNVAYGKPKDGVNALGKGFGTTKDIVWFGDVKASIVQSGLSPHWGDTNVEMTVPSNLVPGPVPVQVEVKKEKSNPVYFDIVSSTTKNVGPVISHIDPVTTTVKSLITISGTGFGDGTSAVSKVYFNSKANNDCSGTDCQPAIVSLAQQCGDTWKNDQIIVQVPDTLEAGKTYYIVVQNDSALKTDGKISIAIESGSPLPGICGLTPSTGPSPLPQDHNGLTLVGSNFTTKPTVYFYKKGESFVDKKNWYVTDVTAVPKLLKKATDTEIITMLPFFNGGFMGTGPIKVGVNNELSNSIAYTVEDCSVAGSQAPGIGYQCCTANGPDKGLWKKDDQICKGDTRLAGYVWRFTTGIFPDIPKVVEQCKTGVIPAVPASPSPWISQGEGSNACLDAVIRTQFTTTMDVGTFNSANIKVFSCTEMKGNVCVDKKPVTIVFTKKESTYFEAIPEGGKLAENTWYHVELSSSITAYKEQTVAGQKKIFKQPLVATSPCGDGTAYCFDFKSGAGLCEVKEVGIIPPKHKTNDLGIVQDPAFLFDNNILSPQHPLVYSTWAQATQACTMMDTTKMQWDWKIDPAVAEAGAAAKVTKSVANPSLATAEAVQHYPVGANIIAATPSKGKELTGVSTLIIDLLVPKVIGYEPNCSESCLNPQIRVQFNRQMDITTYQTSFSLWKCVDGANCDQLEKIPVKIDIASTKKELIVPVNLTKSSYYKAVIKGVKPIAGYNNGVPVAGTVMDDFNWTFKTQNSDAACAVGNVLILPDPYTAKNIGEKVQYSATPFSSPNACSKYGQALNKWAFAYKWETLDPSVAAITNFPNVAVGDINASCSISCVTKGSDITVDNKKPQDIALCGNSVVDPGEDCDIGMLGETVGVSCSLTCIRPGNKDKNSCGNGKIETALGEFCDPKDNSAFCSEDCRPFGSGGFDPNKVGASVCGDGNVGKGEACDTGINDATANGKINCTEQCLHTGTKMATFWCDTHKLFAGKSECISSVSECGNAGRLESDEECEFVGKETKIRVGDIEKIIPVDPNSLCSKNCRLQNACSLTAIQVKESIQLGGLWCEKGTEGCSNDCRKAGSSPLYSTPSLCGDGTTGIGEYEYCEVKQNGKTAGSSPVQVVTAKGEKVPAADIQQTTVKVTLSTSTLSFTATSTFALQCGYTEFSSPQIVNNKTVFNDCPNADQGVSGISSCCLPRPIRVVGSEYPLNGAGFNGTPQACPNTAIFATFSKEIKEDTLSGDNIRIARGFIAENTNCATVSSGSVNVTEHVNKTIAFGSLDGQSFFKKLWVKIAHFFTNMFKTDAFAENINDTLKKYKTWCTVDASLTTTALTLPATNATVTSTKVMVNIDKPLTPETVHVVLLKGGAAGIVDMSGVGIRNPNNATTLHDLWVFTTKKELCKIDTVSVAPENFTFVSPKIEQEFLAVGKTKDSQFIVSTPAYKWAWEWDPGENPVFDIPKAGTATNTPQIIIAPKGTQGKITAVASARILEDSSQIGSQKGAIISGTSNLTAFFCETPWTGYTDSMFNMTFTYCPDAGKTGDTLDDLPYIKVVDVTNESSKSIKQCLITGKNLPPKSCTADSDCSSEKLYNLPFDDANKDLCKSSDAAVLQANACTVYSMGNSAGVCLLFADGIIQYPPNYGEIYRGCTVDSDCKTIAGKKESCYPFSPGWKVENNTCFQKQVDAKKAGSTSQNTLKKALFVSDKSDDVIGLQIFENNKRLSAQEWFSQEFIGLGQTQPQSIAGYDAVSDGSNYYINALNIDKKTNQVFNNIYLFSVNPDAADNMKSVMQKIMTSLTFNTNMSNHGYCRKTNSVSYDDISSVACTSDFDCIDALGTPILNTNGQCSNEKTRFLRDWTRLYDVQKIQKNLEAYKNDQTKGKGNYPDLKSGTFIPSYSVSKWSSWKDVIKGGDMPSDPINKWSQCAGPDQETCWNSTDSTFVCPKKTSVYEYSFNSSTKKYSLHIPFEFFTYADPIVKKQLTDTFIAYPDLISASPKCEPLQTYSAFGGSCGDGMVQPGEECDPAGKKYVTSGAFGGLQNACPAGQFRELTCETTCKWKETKACSTGGKCGDGKIEAGKEKCDDGGQNGKYGFCNSDCTGASVAGFCGNNIIDKDAAGKSLEACDLGPSGGYNIDKTKSCSASCTVPGQYCGDGEKQTGEDCDDGNNVNNDECSATCKIEYGTLCLKEKPQFIVHNLTATTSLIFASKVDLATMNGRTKGYLPNNLLNYSKNYYPAVSPIPACQNAPVTAKEICESAGLTCKAFYVISSGAVYANSNCSLKMEVLLDQPEDPSWVECAGEYKPTYGDLVTIKDPLCGNGQKEGDEICDEGAKNGLLCSPQYGNSCTYCAADCKKILTVDPLAFCGNGKLDAGEACDFEGTEVNQTKVLVATSTIIGVDDAGKTVYGKSTVEQCSDKGAYKCTAKCTNLENNCVSCSAGKDKSVPKLAIITPMTSGDKSPYKNDGGEYVELTRPSKNNLYLGYRKINFSAPSTEKSYYNYKGSFYLSPLTPYYLIINSTNGVPVFDLGIETDPLCKDEYKVFFNPNKVSGKGSYFPYPVNGEAPIISNEVIMSPVVPQDTFRVVVRWTNVEAEKNVSFYGATYVVNNGTGHKLYSYQDTIPKGDTWPNVFHAVEQNMSGYWMPAVVQGEGQTPYNGGIYVHSILHGEKTYVQSYTIDMSKMINSANPIGFVVHTDGGPIYPYRENAQVKVEVYKYREGQNAQYSIYEPDMVFSINKAANTTSNKSAKYWQPFNIVKKDGKFIIDAPVRIEPKKDAAGNVMLNQDGTTIMIDKPYPDGVINTGICEVTKSVPGASVPAGCK